MATIVNNPGSGGNGGGDSGLGMLLGVIVGILLVIFLIVYGVPYFRADRVEPTPSPNVEVNLPYVVPGSSGSSSQ